MESAASQLGHQRWWPCPCFGHHSRFGGHSALTCDVRQIFIDQSTLGKCVETWVKLENEEASRQVVLNATSRLDGYPDVMNMKSWETGY